jgi:hypothetical protein
MDRSRRWNLPLLLALSGLSSGAVLAAASTQAAAIETFTTMPLYFEPNQGQTEAQVKFLSRGAGHTLFLTRSKAVLVLPRRDPEHRQIVVDMAYVGANRQPQISGREELTGRVNYFIGDGARRWHTNIATYGKVLYRELYPGIDLVYYGRQGRLEYDFVVRPGADLRRIVLGFSGVERLEVDPQGDLVLHTDLGVIRQRKPMVYQEIGGARREVSGSYVLQGTHRVGFKVAAHDASRPLIIDPVLFFSTYLSGSGGDLGYAIAADSAGNAYVTGYTASTNFPTTPGAFQTSIGGGSDAFVTKLNPTGAAPLVYSTYLGGGGGDIGYGIAVDSAGNAYATGFTNSTNFPTTPGAFQTSSAGNTAFVAKLNPAGSALVYSTYLGGGGPCPAPTCSDGGRGIAVDSLGNAYVTGNTYSTSFPTTPGAFQATSPGGNNAFVTKLNPAGSAPLLYSTYLGGSGDDDGRGIAVDSQGNAYVTGITYSTDFPTTAGAFQTTYAGGGDAYVTKLNPAGSAQLLYSTFLGGSLTDFAQGIAVDSAGNAFVTGGTESTNFPTTAGAFRTTRAGGFDAYVAKLNPAGSAPLVYSTYLGGTSNDAGYGIAVDGVGNAYATGLTNSTDFPTTVGAVQGAAGGSSDAFVTKLNPAGSAPLIYSTYLGGTDVDFGQGIALDGLANAYVTGHTYSTNFPTTPGAFQAASGGSPDAFVAKITDVQLEECPASGGGQCEQAAGGGNVNDNGSQGQFSFIVRRPSTTHRISGALQYVSPANGTKLQSLAVTSLVIAGNTATLEGTCTDDGVSCTFIANVTDSGPIGSGDMFTIAISGGPARGGTLRSGKIQVRPR